MHDNNHWGSNHLIPGTNRVHRVKESCGILGIARSTYYLLRKEGFIAPPIKIGKRARGHTSEYLQTLMNRMGA